MNMQFSPERLSTPEPEIRKNNANYCLLLLTIRQVHAICLSHLIAILTNLGCRCPYCCHVDGYQGQSP